ncbi:MAG TPA: GTPase Era [Gammaproteobacteria bacterium]|nr:GTPase Era [Gammaproteobacteria bacterium]
METDSEFRCGHVALLGRPNVGKSTLLNALVGEKLSIVSHKPHTTRNRILGVLNRPAGQAVFIDTPGFSRRSSRVLHRLMARSLRHTQEDADLIVLVTEATRPVEADAEVIEVLERGSKPVIVAINKVDRLKSKEDLLPMLDALRSHAFEEFVPISARKGTNLAALEQAIMRHLPAGPALYPAEFKTDKNVQFRAAEIIREKLINELHQEIPYGLAVEIEGMETLDDGRRLVRGVIWIERESQKAIVIGSEGKVLKRVGSAARPELNRLFGERVHLTLWVKVREHWSDNAEELRRLGFDSL